MYFCNLVDVAKFVRRTHNTFHADDVKDCLSIMGSFNKRRIERNEKTMVFVASLYIEESQDLIFTTISMTKLDDERWEYMETVDNVVENYVPFFLKTYWQIYHSMI